MKQVNGAFKPPLFWASMFRIIATLLIFLFHSLRQSNIAVYDLNIVGISIFCFLTGFFSYPIRGSVLTWFFNRAQKILIPYWLVIIPVIAVNYYYNYKENSLFELIIIAMGGAMFIEDPLYVVSWYITFILILYAGVSLYTKFKSAINRFLFLILGVSVYYLIVHKLFIYLIMFIIGYLFKVIRSLINRDSFPTVSNSLINNSAFIIQNHCYSFFLIHGGVLISLKEFFSFKTELYIVFAFIISSVLTIFHRHIANNILEYLQTKQVLKTSSG